MLNFCRTELINFGNSFTERPDPASFERHCHKKYELLYIVRGKGECIVEGSEYPLSDGALFILRPFEYHYVRLDKDAAYERYVCNFSEEILMDAVKKIPLLTKKSNGIYFPREALDNNFCNVLSAGNSYFERNSPESAESEAMCISLVNTLLLMVSDTGGDAADNGGLVGKIIRHINRHITEKISLEETAKKFFISKYYLCRLFKRQTGLTVTEYINSKRIAMAQHLISRGEPPTQVAFSVGFGDYSTFYRAYVKETGKAPSREPIE